MTATEQSSNPPQIDAYFNVLQGHLSLVPELKPGLDLARDNPELATSIYSNIACLYLKYPR